MPAAILRSIVESLLFVADGPLTLDRLCTVLEEYDRDLVRAALAGLVAEYEAEGRGIALVQVAGGFQFRSRPEHADYIRRLRRGRVVKFSQSALETLAIIAYRQPVTRAEIEYLRGVDVGGVLKSLMEKKLIRILGKKGIPGKPLIYGTTKEFMSTFGLKDLASLPSLKEVHELADDPTVGEQAPLPLDAGVAD